MDDLKTQQVEALQVAAGYSEKIATAIKNIISEYTGDRKTDTDDYQQHILQGLNWIIQVYNGTRSLLNEDGSSIDKELANEYVIKLNKANEDKDDMARAEAFKGILAFVEEFHKEASKY